jgi:uncharacterized protein YeaO (DUF488 family)
MVKTKRIYSAAKASDGTRILVDRLWPRVLRKDETKVDLWLKEIGPSSELRKWFGHDPIRWPEFKKRYLEELKDNKELIDQIRVRAKEGDVTLLYAARDDKHNNAVALKDYLTDSSDCSFRRHSLT